MRFFDPRMNEGGGTMSDGTPTDQNQAQPDMEGGPALRTIAMPADTNQIGRAHV